MIGLKTVIPPPQQRPALFGWQAVRNWNRPAPVTTNAISETTHLVCNRSLGLQTQILITAEAMVAMHAGTGEPAQSHTIANLQSPSGWTQGNHFADHLVSAHKWVLGHFPFICPHRQITVTDATGLNLDIDIFRTDFRQFVLEKAAIRPPLRGPPRR